jgi:hypothetical protein
MAEAVESLGAPVTVDEVKQWVAARYPDEILADVRENLYHLTVNAPSRVHYDRTRTNWRSDSGHPRDRLFKTEDRGRVVYEIYDPCRHGYVDLRRDPSGKWAAVPIETGRLAAAEFAAQAEAFKRLPPLDNEQDARTWALQAVAQRRGQAIFRSRLLEAYGSRCAISGYGAIEVLEAAHILPYRGEHTNRLDNGLLLRADLHTLFDCGLLWIGPDSAVVLAPALLDTEYAEFHGRPLRMPELEDARPDAEHLSLHARLAQERCASQADP